MKNTQVELQEIKVGCDFNRLLFDSSVVAQLKTLSSKKGTDSGVKAICKYIVKRQNIATKNVKATK